VTLSVLVYARDGIVAPACHLRSVLLARDRRSLHRLEGLAAVAVAMSSLAAVAASCSGGDARSTDSVVLRHISREVMLPLRSALRPMSTAALRDMMKSGPHFEPDAAFPSRHFLLVCAWLLCGVVELCRVSRRVPHRCPVRHHLEHLTM
jgi:hypothetical protein